MKSVTKNGLSSYISSIYNIDKSNITIEQFGRKQLFIVKFNNQILLYSYYTIVGVVVIDRWMITDKKYLKTTNKHLIFFKRHVNNCYKPLTEQQFNRLLCNRGLTV